MIEPEAIPVETDVLIIGGGAAGCMAAIRAAEDPNVKVTLVDKSNTVASGCTASGIDHTWAYIPPIHEKMGYTIEDMAEDHRLGTAAGFFRRDLFNLVAGTLSRALDVKSIIDNAELVMRSSLERQESRPSFEFRRAEYPDQDDKNWLVFLAIRKEGGNFAFSRMPIEKRM